MRLFYRSRLSEPTVWGCLHLLKKSFEGGTAPAEIKGKRTNSVVTEGTLMKPEDLEEINKKGKAQQLADLTPLEPRWDQIWCTLQGDLMILWRTEEDAIAQQQTDPSKKNRPLGVIFLKDCEVSELGRFDPPSQTSANGSDEEESLFGFYDYMEEDERKLYNSLETKQFTFILNALIWMWEGDYHGGEHDGTGERFQFQFAADTHKNAEAWLRGLREGIADVIKKNKNRQINRSTTTALEEKKELETTIRMEVSNNERTMLLPLTELKVQKHSRSVVLGQKWKQRFIGVTLNAIYIYKKKSQPKNSRWTKPSELIALNATNVTVKEGLDPDPNTKIFVFQVSSDLWMKDSVLSWSKRSFVFGHTSLDEAQRWINIINRQVKQHAQARARKEKKKRPRI